MRFVTYRAGTELGLAVALASGRLVGVPAGHPDFPGDLLTLLQGGMATLTDAHRRVERWGAPLDLDDIEFLPPVPRPGKVVCVGLNYRAHSTESGFDSTSYPTLFGRFATSLTGHRAPLLRPIVSEQLDFEGELAMIIGRPGRYIARDAAHSYVAGYSIFNDGSVRDYQFKATQGWTAGKNFDRTGAFGPVMVTADELPPGAKGLALQTRLNGVVVQQANTEDMVFDVAALVSLISEVMTLEPGDVIATGTPSGIGYARTPKLFMKAGDVCEVEIEGIGVLSNRVVDEPGAPGPLAVAAQHRQNKKVDVTVERRRPRGREGV